MGAQVTLCFKMEQKLQYARWKAADGAKALREGRAPKPGPRKLYPDYVEVRIPMSSPWKLHSNYGGRGSPSCSTSWFARWVVPRYPVTKCSRRISKWLLLVHCPPNNSFTTRHVTSHLTVSKPWKKYQCQRAPPRCPYG